MTIHHHTKFGKKKKKMVERFRRHRADTIEQTDRTTDEKTDRWTDGQSESNIPSPPPIYRGGGLKL